MNTIEPVKTNRQDTKLKDRATVYHTKNINKLARKLNMPVKEIRMDMADLKAYLIRLEDVRLELEILEKKYNKAILEFMLKYCMSTPKLVEDTEDDGDDVDGRIRKRKQVNWQGL